MIADVTQRYVDAIDAMGRENYALNRKAEALKAQVGYLQKALGNILALVADEPESNEDDPESLCFKCLEIAAKAFLRCRLKVRK